MHPELAVQHLASIFGDKHPMIFAFPFRMASALVVVHERSPVRAPWSGSRIGGCSRLPELSNSGSPPAKPGDYLFSHNLRQSRRLGNREPLKAVMGSSS